MSIVIGAFFMVVSLGIAAVVMLENERRSEQYARLSKRRNLHFID